MPKAYITKQQKLNEDLAAWIYGEMFVRHISQTKMAEIMGIKQPSLNRKLRQGNFTFPDLAIIFGVLQPDADTLMRLMGAKNK